MSELERATRPLAAVPDTAALARRDLTQARERLARRLEALERPVRLAGRLTRLLQARPGLVVGGAFLVGWGLARLLRRR